MPQKFQKKPRRSGPPRFRGEERNSLIVCPLVKLCHDRDPSLLRTQSDVHKFAGELFKIPLGATSSTTTNVGALLPGPPENPDIPPAPGVQNFRYAWNRPPTNLYNQGAATNFANAMIASPQFPYVRAHFLEIRSSFLVYAGRTLKKAWENKWTKPPNPTAVFSHQQAENARGRQYRVRFLALAGDFSHSFQPVIPHASCRHLQNPCAQ